MSIEVPESGDVYVWVKTQILWDRRMGEDDDGKPKVVDPGRWLDPGSAHPMSAKEARALVEAYAPEIERVEAAEAHHETSRATAKRLAEEAETARRAALTPEERAAEDAAAAQPPPED